MRRVFAMCLIVITNYLSAQPFFEISNQFFRENVKDGLVKYDRVNMDRSVLDDLITRIGNYDLIAVSDAEKKAFYINAYNLLVIHQILNNYPSEGPLEIEGFFDAITSSVAGEKLTLNELEKERLFKAFPDPRIHFVLVCAAVGCPPLADFAYLPLSIEKQLKERTIYVVNFEPFIRVNSNTIQISKIFDWYKADFTKQKNTVIKYIDSYHSGDLADKQLSFYEYDWSLNKY